jgi:hypothetical protein
MSDPLDILDAVHPHDGLNPPPPPEPLGAAAALADATEGAPPFINRRLTVAEWERYIAAYVFPWKPPSRVVLHHTYKPDEGDWQGVASMRAMQRFYAGKGWSSAPHIYTAPDGIWLATPLSRIGIHAGTNNGSVAAGWYSIGLEVVWDGDASVFAGPTWEFSKAVIRGIAARVGKSIPELLAFHRDTSEKSCPGNQVTRAWVLNELAREEAPPVQPTRVIGTRPSVSLAQFRAWLRSVHAPLGEHFDVITERVYTLASWLDIDPAFVAAVWKHETMQTPGRIGSSDLYRKSNNAGGIKAYSADGSRWPAVAHNSRVFNVYESPQLGLFGLVFHLKQRYGAVGLLDVETIIPVWAPGDDENNPASYQADVKRVMAAMKEIKA